LTPGVARGYTADLVLQPALSSAIHCLEAPMAVDIQKFFNEDVPAKIAKNPEAAKSVGAKYQFIIDGEGGGSWFIDASASGPSCVAGNPGTAECTMQMTTESFQKLMEDPKNNGVQLFFGGKLKVTGNNMLAMKLNKLFEI